MKKIHFIWSDKPPKSLIKSDLLPPGSGAGGSNNLIPKCYTFLDSGGLAELLSEEKLNKIILYNVFFCTFYYLELSTSGAGGRGLF